MRRILLIFLAFSFVPLLYTDPLFFPEGSDWKYLDDGSDQGTLWKETGFDDFMWETGAAQLGFGDGDEATLLESGHICYYFRKIVTVDDLSGLDQVFFDVVHDDGMVLYINGAEVERSPLMPQFGPITYLTTPSTFIPTEDENNFWTYIINPSYFTEGNNTIAISIHNQSTSSSDVSFDCRVSDSIIYETDGPYVFYRNDEIIVKTIEEDGPQTYTYDDSDSVELICRFPNYADSFYVELQPELLVEESEYPLPEKFLAVSDIEGNLEAFVMLLQDTDVIDEEYNWIFGDGHLIFNGDMFDRGTNVTECLWLLYKLEYEAEAVGGKIHFVMGNHDIMNLIYDFRYVNAKYIENAGLMGETLESVYASDTELGRWLRTKNLIEKVGPIVFVHGGISPSVANLNLSLDDMNFWGRYRMDEECSYNECLLINGGSDYGLYWYRGMADMDLTQQQVDNILSQDNINAQKVVIGHSVFDEITLLYEARVIGIDLDHEENFNNGFMEALYYEAGDLFRFQTFGFNVTYTFLNSLVDVGEEEISDIIDLNLKCFPNPFNPTVAISFTVQEKSLIDLTVYDVKGRKVKTLISAETDAGNQSAIWDGTDNSGKDVSGGIYFYKLTAGILEQTKKMILIK